MESFIIFSRDESISFSPIFVSLRLYANKSFVVTHEFIEEDIVFIFDIAFPIDDSKSEACIAISLRLKILFASTTFILSLFSDDTFAFNVLISFNIVALYL